MVYYFLLLLGKLLRRDDPRNSRCDENRGDCEKTCRRPHDDRACDASPLCKGHEVVRGASGTDKQQKLRNGQQYRLKHRCLPLRERKLARQTSPCQASPPVPGACWPTLSFSSGSRAADRPNRGEMPVGVASSLAIAGFGSPSASPMPPASLA